MLTKSSLTKCYLCGLPTQSRIAVLDPNRAKPELRDFYESLTSDVPEGLVLPAAA